MADTFINIPDSGSPSWKDPVSDASLLPATGNSIGDVRVATDTETIYEWNGTSWVVLATASESLAITALNGDVSATGPGTATATVNFVGGVSAANVASGATAANAATSSDTPNTIVKRDSSGNFSAGTISAAIIGNVTGNLTGNVTGNVTGNLTGNVTGTASGNLVPIFNEVQVQQTPGTGQFSSIAAAIASITTASQSNPFLVMVGPGVYTEPQIVMKPYVYVSGAGFDSTVIQPSNPAAHLIIGSDFSALLRCELTGVTGSGQALIYHSSATGSSQTCFYVEEVRFGASDTLVLSSGNNTATLSTVSTNSCRFGSIYSFNTGFYATTSGSNPGKIEIRDLLASGMQTPYPADVFVADENLCEIVINSCQCRSGGTTTGNCIRAQNGALLRILSLDIKGFGTGLYVPNVGSGPTLEMGAVNFENNTNDLEILNTGTTGVVNVAAALSKSTIVSGLSLALVILDTVTGYINTSNAINIEQADGTFTDATTVALDGSAMGMFQGGLITVVSGLQVNVSSGFGYLDSSGSIHKVTWPSTNITLSASSNNYLYFNSSMTLTASSSFPNTENTILLGRVVTNSTGVEFIDASPMGAYHYGNTNDNFIRNALGPVFAYGSIVTEDATVKHLDVTAGSYYFGNNAFFPSAGTNITFQTFYQNGSGGWTIGSTNTVDVNHYDNGSGTLAVIPGGYYARHTLYLVGQGSNQQYLFVYAQTTYPTLVAAQTGNIPTPPSYFTDGVVLIASIIVQEGSTSILPNGQIVDNRPRIGFSLPAVEAVGTVTSVALSLPGSVFSISGSPVTSTGTLSASFTNQLANEFFASPNGSSGVPGFRAIVAADVPTLNQNTTGTAANITATSNSTLTTLSSLSLPGSQVTGNISGNAGNITATSNSTLTTLSALSLPGSQVTGNISGNAANITATSNSTLTTLSSLSLPTSQLSGSISLTTQVSGVLPSANGGTGVNNSFNLTIGGTSSINGTVTGSNSGDVTLAAVGSSPNANAASLSGQVLNLQPASASFPGVVTTGTQTFAGNKTFSGNTSSTNITITGTGGSGYLFYPGQSATPTTPVGGTIVFADSTNRFSQLNTNGFTTTFDSTGITANRVYTVRDVSGKLNMDSRTSYAGFSVSTSPYTILSTDGYSIYFINTSSIPITINLPAISSVSDRAYIFKDVSGNANTNNITIVPSGTNTIEGLNVSKIFQTNFGSWTLVSDTVSGWWSV